MSAEEPARAPELTPFGAVGLSFVGLASFLAVLLLGGALTDGDSIGEVFLAAAWVVAPMTALYVGLLRYAPRESTASAVGLVMPDARDLGLAVAAVLVGVALVPLAVELLVWLNQAFPGPPVTDEVRPAFATRVLMSVAGVVLKPLADELLFRGFIQNRLQRTRTATQAWLLTLVLYALMQLAPDQMLVTLILAGPLGFIALRARSVWVVVIGHVAQSATPWIAYHLGWKALDKIDGPGVPVTVLVACGAVVVLGLALVAQMRPIRTDRNSI